MPSRYPYRIYRNLSHRKDKRHYSVKLNNKVITPRGGIPCVVGIKACFHILPSGLKRAQRERQRNVHAFAQCERLLDLYALRGYDKMEDYGPKVRIYYNPFSEHPVFQTSQGQRVLGAELVHGDDTGFYGYGLDYGERLVTQGLLFG